jgi:hypothetical protein
MRSGTSTTHFPNLLLCLPLSLRQYAAARCSRSSRHPAGKTYRKGVIRPKSAHQQADQCVVIDIVCVDFLEDHADLVDVCVRISLMYYREDMCSGLRGIE